MVAIFINRCEHLLLLQPLQMWSLSATQKGTGRYSTVDVYSIRRFAHTKTVYAFCLQAAISLPLISLINIEIHSERNDRFSVFDRKLRIDFVDESKCTAPRAKEYATTVLLLYGDSYLFVLSLRMSYNLCTKLQIW